MVIKEYSAKWFSSVQWGWTEIEVIAESEEQVRELVGSEDQDKEEYRQRDGKDSLRIVELREIRLPYVTQVYR